MITQNKTLIISLILLFGLITWAAQSYRVNNNATVLINEHGVVKNVFNNACGVDRFVPTNTATEWSNFRTNKPACMTLSDPYECTSTTIHGHSLPNAILNGTASFNHGCPTNMVSCGGAPGSHTFRCDSGNVWTLIENSYESECVCPTCDCN